MIDIKKLKVFEWFAWIVSGIFFTFSIVKYGFFVDVFFWIGTIIFAAVANRLHKTVKRFKNVEDVADRIMDQGFEKLSEQLENSMSDKN